MRSSIAQTPVARKAALILGDQLNDNNLALLALNKSTDLVVFIESFHEASQVWSHKARIALFFSAMRHFAHKLKDAGYDVVYRLVDAKNTQPLTEQFIDILRSYKIEHALCTEPGDWRLKEALTQDAASAKISLQMPADVHFLCDHETFDRWAKPLKSLRMEFFYRNMRRQYKVLIDAAGEPEGGQWNFDAENRKGFPKAGPGNIPDPSLFAPDALTQQAIADVERVFATHPGKLDKFAWPVTRDQALLALERFVAHRLPNFGDYQDAMWTGMPFGWHSLIASNLNLKLLAPLEVIAAVETAWRNSLKSQEPLSLPAVEGFIRQILGWREFIRGVYWLDMPKLKADNYYGHNHELPDWYWSGKTKMVCMQQSIGQTLEYGYAHHIQRLMVTGNFALMAEINPQQVADWYLAVYVDAVEWVELPNVAGMALFANGGRFTSKPYVASGAYIKRMSNYCSSCPYKPDVRHGDNACPLTTLYWNFLQKHEDEFSRNPRTALMAKNIQRLTNNEKIAISEHAQKILKNLNDI